jgi:gliding motility-associated-like protein
MKIKYHTLFQLSFILLIYCFTFNQLTAQTPGGISAGLQLWLKANAGATTAGVNLTAWQDQSAAATAVTVNGSPDLINPGYNYNPYINFTNSFGTGGDFLRVPTTYFQSYFWVAQLNNLSRASTHLATYDGVTLGQPCNGCPIHGGSNGGAVAQYHELGYGNSTFQAAGMWRKNGTATGIAYNTPHSGKFDIVTALGSSAVVTNVFMGGQNSNGGFDGRARDWLGPVGEIIAYTTPITAVQANKVESYLGVKYGITLGGNGATTVFYTAPNGTTIWPANTGYHNDVAGIGNDNVVEALNQPKSHSINIPADAVIMANGNFAAPVALADGEYLMWGHNNGPLTYTCQNYTHAGPATTLNALWGRTWRTQKTGTLAGSVIIDIDMSMLQGPSGLGTTNNADVRLLVDDNTAFADGSAGEHTYTPNAGFSASSGQLFFTVPYADIQNGIGFFALGFIATSPTVTITATTNSICPGGSVTFTATPTNGGTIPTYQWQVNGANAGTNAATFTTTTLNNNDVVTVILTSNAACVSPATATSNSITISVSAALVPAAIINASSNTICAGTSVSFTATPTNGGAAPSYQWQVNGSNVGFNFNVYGSSTLTNNDVVSVIMTSNAACVSPTTVTSNTITMTVNPVLIPSVSIAASLTTICAGTSVTFTATPTNGGTAPNYQWQINGVNAGTNSTTFTSSTLTNNAAVTVILTSNATCVSPVTATSNTVTIAVNPVLIPSISIAASLTTICAGTSVSFTATPTNGGTLPSYQWQVNGVNAGTNATTFTSTTLTNNDAITVVLTSNATCAAPATVTSNTVVITVNPILVPSATIVASNTTICIGASVTFTATPTNGGTAPNYQWQVNGVNVGTNATTFTSSALTNNAAVTVIVTSNATCVSPLTATSNTLIITVNTVLVPSVSIAASLTTICAGTSVTFTATPTNGGVAPSYQWQVNGVNAGTNASTFTSTTLNNTNSISVILTSSEPCAAPVTASSNTITITVNPVLLPIASVVASSTTICAGTSVSFTVTPTNGGTLPSYQWQVNGVNAGTNATTFASSTLTNNSIITVLLASNATCAAPATVTSNTIVMTVNPILAPAVAIVASSTTSCIGTPVTFTATPTNGGTSPAYQWQLNGINAGSNSNTFTPASLANGDVVSVILTSNAACISTATATSNTITITVNPSVIPSVSITSSVSSICAGAPVTFSASPTNGGTAPSYQWQINGVNAGTNAATFTTTSLNSTSVVTVVLSSNAPCALPATAVSPGITINVTPQPIANFNYNSSVLTELNPNVPFTNYSINSTSWLWDFGAGNTSTLQNPNFTFAGPGSYWVTLSAYNGVCMDSISHIIKISSYSTYYIPNAFTPNGDGINDVFSMKGTGISAANFEMRIYNRWGEAIFQSNDILKGWNGKTKSDAMAEDGVYVYVINFRLDATSGGTTLSKTGEVILVK